MSGHHTTHRTTPHGANFNDRATFGRAPTESLAYSNRIKGGRGKQYKEP